MKKVQHYFVQHQEYIIVSGIFIIALGLRLYHLNFGLPRLYLEDEEFFVQPALRIASGAWNPQWFGAPAQPLIYLLAALFRLLNFIFNLLEQHRLAAWQQYTYALHLSTFQTIGRIIPAVAGAIIPILGYGIARFWSRSAAIYSSSIITTSFYLVLNSHIIRPDIIQTTLLLSVIYAWLHIMHDPTKHRWYTILGISFGLAVNIKYPSLFILPGLFSVLIILAIKKQFKPRWWCQAGIVSLVTSFCTGPFLYLSFAKVLQAIQIENRIYHPNHGDYTMLQKLWWYSTYVLNFEVGTLLYIISLGTACGLIITILRKHQTERDLQFFTIIVAALGYLLCLTALQLHWERWVIPVATCVMILAGIGLATLHTMLRKHIVIWTLFCVVIFAAPTLRLVRILYSLSHAYTVEIARSWLLENIPAQTKVAAEPFAPILPAAQYTTVKVPYLSSQSLTSYQAQDIEYAIITEKVYGAIKTMSQTSQGANYTESNRIMRDYDEILVPSDLVYSVDAHHQYTPEQLIYSNDISVLRTWRYDVLLGPYVRIYKLKYY